jgi:hypothetical protein
LFDFFSLKLIKNKNSILNKLDKTKEYAKPITPNNEPRYRIPVINMIVEETLEITRRPLFS